MTWLFHKVIVLKIIKAPTHNLTRLSLDAFRPFGLISRACPVITKNQNPIFAIIGRYYIFHIIANMGFWFLVMTGQALLMSPKGQNASRDGLVKLSEGLLLFSILLLCEKTTLFV